MFWPSHKLQAREGRVFCHSSPQGYVVQLLDAEWSFGFGLAGKQGVLPRTITVDYASAEVLLSFMDQVAEAEFKGSLIIGPAADLWSSAVVLYVMLTGQLPFDCKHLHNPGEGPLLDRYLEAMFQEHCSLVSILRAVLFMPGLANLHMKLHMLH